MDTAIIASIISGVIAIAIATANGIYDMKARRKERRAEKLYIENRTAALFHAEIEIDQIVQDDFWDKAYITIKNLSTEPILNIKPEIRGKKSEFYLEVPEYEDINTGLPVSAEPCDTIKVLNPNEEKTLRVAVSDLQPHAHLEFHFQVPTSQKFRKVFEPNGQESVFRETGGDLVFTP